MQTPKNNKATDKCCPCPENPDLCKGECTCHHTPSLSEGELVEEFYQHMLKSTPVLNSFERASLKLKVISLLSRTRQEEKKQMVAILDKEFDGIRQGTSRFYDAEDANEAVRRIYKALPAED